MRNNFILTEEESKRILSLHNKEFFLNEKKNNNNLNEQISSGVVGSAALGFKLYGIPGAVIGASLGLLGQSYGSSEGVKKIFQACKAQGVGPQTLNGNVLDKLVKIIWDAGGVGGYNTNEEAIKKALKSIPTIPDLCALSTRFAENHPGRKLFDFLDLNFDDDEQWNEFVYQPLLTAVRKSRELAKVAAKTPKTQQVNQVNQVNQVKKTTTSKKGGSKSTRYTFDFNTIMKEIESKCKTVGSSQQTTTPAGTSTGAPTPEVGPAITKDAYQTFIA